MSNIRYDCDLSQYKKVINIDLDRFDQYIQVFKKEIEHSDRYIDIIKKNKVLYNDYLSLCDVVIQCDKDYCMTRQNAFQTGGGPKYRTVIAQDGLPIQVGGDSGLISIFGVTVVTGLIGILFYWLFSKKEKKCHIMYPLYNRTQIPNVAEIIGNIVPVAWIKKARKEGKSSSEFIADTLNTIEVLSSKFEIFDETAGSLGVRVTKSVTKVGLSAVGALVTVGTVGSNLVNIPFMIARAVAMIGKIMSKLIKIFKKVEPILKKGISLLQKVNGALGDADRILAKVESAADVKKFVLVKMQVQFLYDIFNVNFKGGPFHCRCWLDYIMKIYISSNKDREFIMSLICMINDLYSAVNQSVIGFIGSAIDSLVPNTMGMGGTLSQLTEGYTYVLYQKILQQMNETYNDKIPEEMQILIENPKKMKVYFFSGLKKGTLGASELLIPESIKDYMGAGIDLLASGINRGMSTMFMFLNIFVIFGEINAGLYNMDSADTLNKEKLLLECEKYNEQNTEIINRGKSAFKKGKKSLKKGKAMVSKGISSVRKNKRFGRK